MSETFDLMAFIDGSSYPTKTVSVYTDNAAMKQAEEYRMMVEGVGADGKPKVYTTEELNKAQLSLDALSEQIESSALNFELQGMPFEVAKEIANVFAEEGADDEPTDDNVLELISKTIKSVTNSKGAAASIPDVEQLKKMRTRLSPLEFSKLIHGTVEVSFSAVKYEAEVDAGFLSGSADLA